MAKYILHLDKNNDDAIVKILIRCLGAIYTTVYRNLEV